jgi:hypothetical protein
MQMVKKDVEGISIINRSLYTILYIKCNSKQTRNSTLTTSIVRDPLRPKKVTLPSPLESKKF